MQCGDFRATVSPSTILQNASRRTVLTILCTPIALPTLIRASPSTQQACLTEAETITQTSIIRCTTSAAAALRSGKIAGHVVFSIAPVWIIALLSGRGDDVGYGSKAGDQRFETHGFDG
ncbi:hypothetical protein MMC29_001822 [Sticta canariensis]|nr:hypothetical protein [Sticta canariensis]